MKTEYLLDREVELVLAMLTPSNRLAMRVSLHTGLRIGDVLALRTQQLSSRISIVEKKTKKRRIVGVPKKLLEDLTANAGAVFVFPSRSAPTTKPRCRQTVWKDVKRASVAFRFPQNVAPHSFRKVYAVALMNKYGDIKKVQRALNHSSPMVTMIYAVADLSLSAKYKKRKNQP